VPALDVRLCCAVAPALDARREVVSASAREAPAAGVGVRVGLHHAAQQRQATTAVGAGLAPSCQFAAGTCPEIHLLANAAVGDSGALADDHGGSSWGLFVGLYDGV
jgi:hypothetical protein